MQRSITDSLVSEFVDQQWSWSNQKPVRHAVVSEDVHKVLYQNPDGADGANQAPEYDCFEIQLDDFDGKGYWTEEAQDMLEPFSLAARS